MISFHGKPEIKAEYVARVLEHQRADQIIQGNYWVNGKGCAVGCTIHGSDHGRYETELGIPRIIARLEDGIFEGLSNEEAQKFPLQFLESIQVGSDLSMVFYHFMHWLLVDPTDGVVKFAKTDAQKKTITDIAELFARRISGELISSSDWLTAGRAAYVAAAYAAYAYAAAYAAYIAAAYAAYAADAAAADAYVVDVYAADAAAADAYAADAAAAVYAAYAYADAYAAYVAAAYAAYAADAAAAARRSARMTQRDKLLQLLREAPVNA